MERSNGIVNAKELRISAAPALLEDLINNRPKTTRPANATAPKPNHTSAVFVTTHNASFRRRAETTSCACLQEKSGPREGAAKWTNRESLEHQLTLHLKDSSRRQTRRERPVGAGRRSYRVQDLSKVAGVGCAGPGVHRLSEVRMVEHVVGVRADTEGQALRQLEVLVDAEIRVKEPRAAEQVADLIRECRAGAGKRCRVGALAQSVAAASLSGTDNLGRNQGRARGIVVEDAAGIDAVKHGVRQSAASEEVLRDRPAANGAVDELVAELPRGYPDVLGVEGVADVVIRVAVVIAAIS